MACYIGCLLLPHDGYIRYQAFKKTIFDYVPRFYERIHFDETPIDVVFIGSSRTGRAVNKVEVQEELRKRGCNLNVENFSIAAAGFDIRIAELRELLAKRKIKMLVFGVEERMPRDGHQAFVEIANVSEVLKSPVLGNRNLFKNLARLPYRQMELALASLVPEAFGYRCEFDRGLYEGAGSDHRLNINETKESEDGTESHEEIIRKQSETYNRGILPPILPDHLSFVEFGVSQHYMNEIRRLSEQYGFKVVILFQPFYKGYDAPFDAAYLSQFGPLWETSFLKEDATNFLDALHASDKASAALSPWLADRIAKEFETSK